MASGVVHLGAAASLALYPQSWPYLLGALAGNHGLLAVASMLPRTGLLGPNITRLSEVRETRDEVALTFDDGPNPEVTPAILDILDRARVSASFFCIGVEGERHPQLVTEISRRGHRVENHSYHHTSVFGFLGPGAIRNDILRTQELFERLTGRRPLYFRAPAGIHSPLLEPALCAGGLRLVSWTRRGFDTVSRDADRVLMRLTRNLAGGDIVVLHDGARSSRFQTHSVVLEVLPRMLEAIDQRGLRASAL